MIHDHIGDIHVQLADGKRWLSANSVSANFEITINITDVVFVSVDSLLDDRVHVQLERIDESILGGGGCYFDRVEPEPWETLRQTTYKTIKDAAILTVGLPCRQSTRLLVLVSVDREWHP